MKTCQFRGAQPHVAEGLLCEAEPKARYAMMPCRGQHCFLCQSSSAVQFTSSQSHRFVNQYEAILNCHAVRHRGKRCIQRVCLYSRLAMQHIEHHLCIDVSVWSM